MRVMYKRIIALISALALICGIQFTVYAADSYITLYGFSFDINDNGEAVIHEYDDRSENVVIPEKLLGANVVAIDDYAFFGDTVITSVSFENATHLNYIGIDAFYGCTGLKTLNIPASIGAVQFGSFQNCTGLENAVIESGLTSIGDQAFMGCTSMKYIEIPDSVTSISNTAFKNCGKLVIYCNEGSYAQEYAEQRNIPYLLIYNYELGDVDLNRTINIRDVTTIQMFLAGILDELPTFRGKHYADVTKDGKVNIRDATKIQMKLAGLIDNF